MKYYRRCETCDVSLNPSSWGSHMYKHRREYEKLEWMIRIIIVCKEKIPLDVIKYMIKLCVPKIKKTCNFKHSMLHYKYSYN